MAFSPATIRKDDGQVGTILVQFENEPELSMKNEEYDLVLEVIGHGMGKHRRDVDIMMVLDVSENMDDDDIDAMGTAVLEVVDSLSQTDRLSIVTFAKNAQRKMHFCVMSPVEKAEVETLVGDLKACGPANIGAGLRKALDVINSRKSTKRYPTIMLISKGAFDNEDISHISIDRFPIFTFELEDDESLCSTVLKDIARKSKGAYHMIDPKYPNYDVLIKCVDEFRGKPIKDVKLILKPLKGTVSRLESRYTKIDEVYAGKYHVSPPDETGSRTVSLGSLEEKEWRKVLVTLSLPSVSKPVHIDSLQTFCRFRDQKGNEIKTNPLIFRVKRYATPKVSQGYMYRVQAAKKELLCNKSQAVKYGPYGSQMPETFRIVLDKRDTIEGVIIRHGSLVDSIGFMIQKKGCNADSYTCEFSGRTVNTPQIKILLGSGEHITRISGVHGIHQCSNQTLIGKLWIETNLNNTYGPFGRGKDVVNQRPFSTPLTPHGPMVGFFGRFGTYLESIGIFMDKTF